MDKLTEIMEWKRQEIADRLRPIRESELSRLGENKRPGLSFAQALQREEGLSVIAEIKRKSPSAGEIARIPDAPDQARKYINAHVDCISILTDEKYFGGRLKDLWEVTDFLNDHQRHTPCLRKDFMVHPLQVVEAAEAGAKAILIIVRALDDETIKRLYESASLAGLDSLFEIHDESELERALKHDPQIIGVNNRDLKRFVTDLAFSQNIIPQIPDNIIKISESGIFNQIDAKRVYDAGADAVLVGEALMKAEDPETLIQAFHAL